MLVVLWEMISEEQSCLMHHSKGNKIRYQHKPFNLPAIRVRTTVRHGQHAWASVWHDELLVREPMVPVYGCLACSVFIHKISSLQHEPLNHPMKWAAFVAHGHLVLLELAGAELAEVLGCTRSYIGKELKANSPSVLVRDLYVEKHHGVASLGSLSNQRVDASHCLAVLYSTLGCLKVVALNGPILPF